ncbi:MAG: type IV pilin-like G/H family protein [Microcoleus sp.]
MTAKNLPASGAKASKKPKLPASILLPRIVIYSAVVAGIIASFYDFQLNKLSISSSTEYSQPKKYLGSLNRGQQAYFLENGHFSDDIAKLGLGIKEQTDDYNYTIVSSMGPVQTLQNQREAAQYESAIAIAKPNDMSTGKSYTGAVFAFKEKDSNSITTVAAICESDGMNASYSATWNPPTFDGREIHCQPGTTMLYPARKIGW